MPNFLIASSAFKGSLSPVQASEAISLGLQDFARARKYALNSKIIPLADGGDGTIEAILAACGGNRHKIECTSALDEIREASWLNLHGTAVIELASACGIAGLAELKPLEAHTRGLGIIIKHVVEKEKFENVVIAVGGSASTDGGSGALYEMGAIFLDAEGRQIKPQGGGSLKKIAACDLSRVYDIYDKVKIKVATDVINPLLGSNGAASIFGPQKGAAENEIRILEEGLTRFADVLESACKKHLRTVAGSGAAGGTAFGLACAAGAKIISGFEWISSITGLEEAVKNSDIVITGEGRFDRSSLSGKATGRLFDLCRHYDKRLWIVAASADSDIASSEHCKIIIPVAKNQKQAGLIDLQNAVAEFAQQNLA